MASQTGKQIIKIRILPLNISRNKGNQIMKNWQLTEYNMRHIFLKKLHTKCGREANSRGFYKKSKLSIYLDQMSEILWSFFIVCSSEVYQNILKLKCWSFALTLYLAFLKNKKKSGTCLSISFPVWCLKKNISHAILYYFLLLQLFPFQSSIQ